MRIPGKVLKSVAFIGEATYQDNDGKISGDLHATGFLVHMPSDHFPALTFAYFVTAKRVATDLKDRKVYFLVNSNKGGTTTLANSYPHWWLHPTDETADLAVLQVGGQSDLDTWGVGLKDFVTAEDIRAQTVAVGDEVFTVSLFTRAPGQSRNMPIVRTGNVAMFPEEQIQTELGFADAYLVEARSIGGISGSPVFIRKTITLPIKLSNGTRTSASAVGDLKLLGLMQGHWDIKESEKNAAEMTHDRRRGVNLGIGIVVPAAKIMETLNQPDLVRSRELSEEDLRQKLQQHTKSDLRWL